MSASLRIPVSWAVVLLLLVGGRVALAGEVVVHLVERDGSEVRYQRVELWRVLAPEKGHWRQRLAAETDLNGHARFSGVPVGDWTVHVSALANDRLVPPHLNPIRPQAVVSVGQADPRQSVEVVLDRGAVLRVRVQVDVRDAVSASLSLHHVDTGFETEVLLRLPHEEHEMVLAPGRWRVGIRVPRGYLLMDVTLDDWSLPGATAQLESRADGAEMDLAFHLSGRARLFGTLSGPTGCGAGGVVARLIEPGPWFEAVNARGGSEFSEIEARVNKFCELNQVLPDGTWLVRPLGEHHESVEPPEVELVIPNGGAGVADFSITPRSGDGAAAFAGLFVRVRDPEGRRLSGALVEVSRPGEAEPLRAQRTDWGGLVSLPALPRGPLRIVAGTPRFLDSEREVGEDAWAVPMKEFERRRPVDDKLVELRLVEGPLLQFEAVDEGGEPLVGARLRVDALDEPQGLLRDSDIARSRRVRDLRTDAEGSARLEGLYPGAYRVRADLLGERASTHLVRIGDEGRGEPREAEIELPESGRTVVPLTAVRAGRLVVPVGCEGEATLPTTAHLRIVRAFAHDERPDEAQLLEEAVLVIDDHPLSGQHRDELTAGPLEGGAWLMAFRPAGFDRWTWYPGGEDAAEAEVIFLDSDDDTPLERIGVDCGPLFTVVLTPAGDSALPDLTEARVEGEWKPRDELRLHQGKGGALTAERRAGSVLLRGAETGPASLRVELSHPLLAPERITFDSPELELEQGERRLLEAPVRVLGALQLEVGAAGLLVLTPAAGAPRELPVQAGPVLVPRVTPGTWSLQLRERDSGGALLWSRRDVVVEAGRVTQLPPAPGRDSSTSR